MKARRTDENQIEIVKTLRSVGASVHVSSSMGGGFPDVVVGYHGRTYLLEIKDGEKFKSAQALTPQEIIWHDNWRGHAVIVNSKAEALAVIGVTYN